MTRQKQDRQFWIKLVHVFEEAQTVHVGHADVANDNPIKFTGYVTYRFRTARKSLDGKAGQFQRLNLRVEKISVVINQDNPWRHFGIEIIRNCHGYTFFNFTMNVAPPFELSTFSSPPRSRTMS